MRFSEAVEHIAELAQGDLGPAVIEALHDFEGLNDPDNRTPQTAETVEAIATLQPVHELLVALFAESGMSEELAIFCAHSAVIGMIAMRYVAQGEQALNQHVAIDAPHLMAE
jgi:hypothetical protein